MNVVLKALLLVSAAVTAVVRFISFKYAESFTAETLDVMLKVSITSAVICVICALIWVIRIKKEEKNQKNA